MDIALYHVQKRENIIGFFTSVEEMPINLKRLDIQPITLNSNSDSAEQIKKVYEASGSVITMRSKWKHWRETLTFDSDIIGKFYGLTPSLAVEKLLVCALDDCRSSSTNGDTRVIDGCFEVDYVKAFEINKLQNPRKCEKVDLNADVSLKDLIESYTIKRGKI